MRQGSANSWVIQSRVVGALLMREVLTRYGRHNIGFLWLFFEPMMFTLGVTALWSVAKIDQISTLPIVAFAMTGYSSVLLWRNMPARCISAIEPNLALLYHRNVRVLDVFMARLLLEAAGTTMSFVVLILVFWGIEWIEPPENVLAVAGAWAMLAWFGFGLALLLGALSWTSEIVEKIWHPMAYLLFPLSGAAFLVDSLPTRAQDFILLLPMVHGVEWLREGFFGSAINAHYDIGYMAAWNAALTIAGLLRVRAIAGDVTPE
ncbi:transport permease protein [Polymorphobacter multimanifer]|uniref:ABC-2 type transport system permease protein/capsular polysaccharide transport system permease protein n=1 Tax=Polymorphobacter multimanifer TaxID=1070431 RepID=A0A841L5A8_9SPHN|nr:ABC-2 type transport system permease protein/capsular polysaccharide transport system permease protein [Polymorphobacter multimanifer]GGI78774.1 transport permease protein [Polymorphobacter multimanifer]